MSYEYEHRLRNYLIGHKNVNPKFDGFEVLKSLDELKEVYRKAKAWDNYIAKVRERVRFTENTDDDIERETQKVIDYYMERVDDEN